MSQYEIRDAVSVTVTITSELQLAPKCKLFMPTTTFLYGKVQTFLSYIVWMLRWFVGKGAQ